MPTIMVITPRVDAQLALLVLPLQPDRSVRMPVLQLLSNAKSAPMPTLPRVLVRVARQILPQLPDPLHHLLADVMPTSTALFQLLALLAQLVLPVLHLQLDPLLKVPVLLEGLPHRAQRTPMPTLPRVLVRVARQILSLQLDPVLRATVLNLLLYAQPTFMDLMLRVNVQLAQLVLPRLLGPILRVTVLDRLPPPAPATFTDLMPQANVQLALLGL